MVTLPCTTNNSTTCPSTSNPCSLNPLSRRTSRWSPERASSSHSPPMVKRIEILLNRPSKRVILTSLLVLREGRTARSATTSGLISCSTWLPPRSTKALIGKSTLSTRGRAPSRISRNFPHTVVEGTSPLTPTWGLFLKALRFPTRSSRLTCLIKLWLSRLPPTRPQSNKACNPAPLVHPLGLSSWRRLKKVLLTSTIPTSSVLKGSTLLKYPPLRWITRSLWVSKSPPKIKFEIS